MMDQTSLVNQRAIGIARFNFHEKMGHSPFRAWMDEVVEDLAALARAVHPPSDAQQREARATARAEHNDLFHPPEEDEAE